MRWSEIAEGSPAEEAQKESQRRIKANQKIADARRKKADAARAYQDKMIWANNAEQNAKSKLRGD